MNTYIFRTEHYGDIEVDAPNRVTALDLFLEMHSNLVDDVVELTLKSYSY